jgi:hypothetical protein
MPADTAKVTPNNGTGTPAPPVRRLPPRDDNEGTIQPKLLKTGYIRFLTLRDLDQRTRAAEKANATRSAFERDLGGGEHLTEGQNQLVQRASILSAMLEDFEVRYSIGQPVEFSDYMTGCNVLRRILCTIGLERRARDVGASPSLSEYLRGRSVPEDVVVGVANGQAEPTIEAGLELVADASTTPSADVEAVGESKTPAGSVPARPLEKRTHDAPQSQRSAIGEASTSAGDRLGNPP